MSVFSMLLLSMTLVYAQENFNETKKLIDSEISCDRLTNEQIEAMGDYYMEQMHPGEAHEMMHKMMGGEDSETVKLMHINMAKSIYCGETNQEMIGMMSTGDNNGEMMSNEMMGGNMMASGNGMMSSGMMGNSYYQTTQNSPYQNNFLGFQIFFYIIQVLIIVILILMIILLINKSKRSAKQKGRKTK